MAEIDMLIQERNADNTEMDTLYPITKARNVTFEDGKTVQDMYNLVFNNVKLWVGNSEPVNAEVNDVWLDLLNEVIKIKKVNGDWMIFGAAYK